MLNVLKAVQHKVSLFIPPHALAAIGGKMSLCSRVEIWSNCPLVLTSKHCFFLHCVSLFRILFKESLAVHSHLTGNL